MISTTTEFKCDVEECKTAPIAVVEEFGIPQGLPEGWAMVSWFRRQEVSNPSAELNKNLFSKLKRAAPDSRLKEFFNANEQSIDTLMPPSIEVVSCKAIICPTCLDKINLSAFSHNSSGFIG